MLAGYTQLSATVAPSTSRINTPSAWSKPQHDAVHRKGRTSNAPSHGSAVVVGSPVALVDPGELEPKAARDRQSGMDPRRGQPALHRDLSEARRGDGPPS